MQARILLKREMFLQGLGVSVAGICTAEQCYCSFL
jgi:hypothetical protein